MFRVVETLYGVTHARRHGAEMWHPERALLRARRSRRRRCVGQFYLDLYAREGKRGGAWMDDAINRRRIGGQRADARSRTSPAISRRPSAASPRSSRTTR